MTVHHNSLLMQSYAGGDHTFDVPDAILIFWMMVKQRDIPSRLFIRDSRICGVQSEKR